MTWELFTRDQTLARTGLVDDYRQLDMTLRFGDVSTWTLTLPADSPAAARLRLGDPAYGTDGLIVVLDGVTILSGPVAHRVKSSGADDRVLTVTGFDDTVWLQRRLVYPSVPPFTAAESDDRTGAAETVMRAYVDANAGPSAASERRVVTLAADLGRGSAVKYHGRFQTLLAACQDLALAGGSLGFRVIQVAAALQFQVYAPTDLTGSARLSDAQGNVESYELEQAAAGANFVIAGGLGAGTARAFVFGGDSASVSKYGRVERFLDGRSADDVADLTLTGLTQARDKLLAELVAKTSLQVVPEDTAALRYATDYNLGDRLTAYVDGQSVVEIVRSLDITVDAERAKVTPRLGTPGDDADRAALAGLADRLTNLEVT